MANGNLDQNHPQNKKDRLTVDHLLKTQSDPNERELVELARLIIRYRNFPGARDIQRDLKVALDSWKLTEEELYTKTRVIHGAGMVYRRTATGEEQDWT
ncbi:DUF3288 family protein [Pleurocapsa sp. FMAR1]|uniref:DUF3288 family protein n=1 Tax=Pleurocapsa sp. FMAR1 TaxID=3040204 RepID=UPI0029C610CE|nr:DUF3288 family protein [Pleurocapsa sp. FMAR1]